jgi:hypothetical protein
MNRYTRQGWFGELHRHALAARGISTSRYFARRKYKGRQPMTGGKPRRPIMTPGGSPEEALKRFAFSDLPVKEQDRILDLQFELEKIKEREEAGEALPGDRKRKSEIQEEVRIATGVGRRKITPPALLTDSQVLESIPQQRLLAVLSADRQKQLMEEAKLLDPASRKSFIIARLPESEKSMLLEQQRLRGLPEFKKPAERLVARSSEEEKGLLRRLEKLQEKQRLATEATESPSELKTGQVPYAKSPLRRESTEEKVKRQEELESKRLAALERAREAKEMNRAREEVDLE